MNLIVGEEDCSAETPSNYVIFKRNGTFAVPTDVCRVKVLAVGGGSGGLSGDGGASGNVRSGEFDVSPGQTVPVTVGSGGEGSTHMTNDSQNSRVGGASAFGSFLSAAGGEGRVGSGNNAEAGAAGGSGGGSGMQCANSSGFNTSTNGSNSSPICNGSRGGVGQAAFGPQLQSFTRNRLAPGAGGTGKEGSTPNYSGGGGGVLLNGSGPSAHNGTNSSTGGSGGLGFGAGGGAGASYHTQSQNYYAGGRGADGLVYIEW